MYVKVLMTRFIIKKDPVNAQDRNFPQINIGTIIFI